jgi:hypothetical protein
MMALDHIPEIHCQKRLIKPEMGSIKVCHFVHQASSLPLSRITWYPRGITNRNMFVEIPPVV